MVVKSTSTGRGMGVRVGLSVGVAVRVGVGLGVYVGLGVSVARKAVIFAVLIIIGIMHNPATITQEPIIRFQMKLELFLGG